LRQIARARRAVDAAHIDNITMAVFHAGMLCRYLRPAATFGELFIIMAVGSGCLSPLHERGVALSEATAPVVDQAAAAYRDANTLHDLRVDYDAVARFDAKDTVYNPRSTEVLLPEKDIQARLTVIAAFQEYVDSLVAVSNGTESPALQAAAKSTGENLSSLANSLASRASSTPSAQAPLLTPDAQNGISTALDALGQFLVSRKIKKELPQKIVAIDPHVQSLCTLLERDLEILEEQERSDYNRIIDQQTLFLRENATMDPEERRAEIMKLPEFVREQRVAEEKLADLHAAVIRLAKTHHELADEAQSRSTESLKKELEDLASAGSNLGSFYSSLPTN
jgi:hypothetical protein